MKQKHADYHVVPYSKIRRLLSAFLRRVERTPTIHGLLEVDVTGARTFLREHKERTGEALSFTAFIATCLAKAVDEHKVMQATRKGRKHLVIFDDVDVYTPIERDVAGEKLTITYIIRAANRKTFREINREIRAAQVQDVTQALEGFKALPWFLLLPTFLISWFFGIFWWMLRRDPQLGKKYGGTVGLTAVGMFGGGSGWGFPAGTPQLNVTVGGIGKKPGVARGQIAIREYLCLTISFNHEMVDGAPAARFTGRLKDLIESGYGLEDTTIELEQVVAPGTAQKSESDLHEKEGTLCQPKTTRLREE